MQNGENNLTQKTEYLFLENIQDLYNFQGTTCTKWADKFSYKNGANNGNYIILADFGDKLNKITFTKVDLKKIRNIYSFIRIYFGNYFVNLICNQKDNGKSILNKINNSSIIQNYILQKLNITQYSINQFIINDFNGVADGFDKVFKLELRQYLNPMTSQNINNLNPSSDVNTRCVLNLNNNNINQNTGPTYIINDNNGKNTKDTFNYKNQKNNNLNFNSNQNNFLKNQQQFPQILQQNQIFLQNQQIILNNMNILFPKIIPLKFFNKNFMIISLIEI